MSKCFVCKNNLGNTYSLRLKKDNNYFHTCSYNCNMKMKDTFDKDYWDFVVNKSDFINPNVSSFKNSLINYEKVDEIKENPFNVYDFENIDENTIIYDYERFERQYKLYIENKEIDELFEGSSDNSSEYSYESDY